MKAWNIHHILKNLATLVGWACDIYHPQRFYKCEINQPDWSWDKLIIYKWSSSFCLMPKTRLNINSGGRLGNMKWKLIEKLWDKLLDLLILTVFFLHIQTHSLMNAFYRLRTTSYSSPTLPPTPAPASTSLPFVFCSQCSLSLGLACTLIPAKRHLIYLLCILRRMVLNFWYRWVPCVLVEIQM